MKLTREHRLHRLFVRRNDEPVEMHLFFDERDLKTMIESLLDPEEFIEFEWYEPVPVAEILNN